MHPIYIPSKGRSDLIKGSIEMLRKEGIDFTVVVDNNESRLYKKRNVDLLVLPSTGTGEAFARREIRKESKRRGEKFHWQINDDIYALCLRKPKEKTLYKESRWALEEIESKVALYSNIGLAGPEEDTWPPSKNYLRANCIPAQAVLINNELDLSFERWKGKGFWDMDLFLQCLEQGFCSLVCNWIRVRAPKPMSSKGGNYEAYIEAKKQINWLESFEKTWSHVVFNPGGNPGGRPSRRWLKSHYTQQLIPI